MPLSLPFLTTLAVLATATAGFFLGARRAWALGNGSRRPLHSLPTYHGLYVSLWTLIPPLVLLLLFAATEDWIIRAVVAAGLPSSATEGTNVDLVIAKIRSLAAGQQIFGDPSPALQAAADRYARLDRWGDRVIAAAMALIAAGGFGFAWRRLSPTFRARNGVEWIIGIILVLCSVIAVLTTVGIVLSVLFEAIRFFREVSPIEFFFGLDWSPHIAIRDTQATGSSGDFGIIPLFVGTALIATIAMAVAVPLGLLSAIYLSEFAKKPVRAVGKPLLEILAGVPTVVYGFFAAVTVAPLVQDWGQALGFDVGGQSALAAGSVMGVMIIPFVSSLSDDVISSVPQKLRDGATTMGATHGEVIRKVVLPAATPGIVGAVLLAVSRAIGETMIVLMAAGLYAKMTFNPLESVTTVTVQIATLLTGDQEFDSANTLSAFALGLVLFVFTLFLNLGALKLTQHYKAKYE